MEKLEAIKVGGMLLWKITNPKGYNDPTLVLYTPREDGETDYRPMALLTPSKRYATAAARDRVARRALAASMGA